MLFYYDFFDQPNKKNRSIDKSFNDNLEFWAKKVEEKFNKEKFSSTEQNCVKFIGGENKEIEISYNLEGVKGKVTITPKYISTTQETEDGKSFGETLYLLNKINALRVRNKNEKESFIDLLYENKTETLPVLFRPEYAELILKTFKGNLK